MSSPVRRWFLLVALLSWLAAGRAAESDGQPGTADYVEYQAGTLPILLTSPHGGRESPTVIASRKQGKVLIDQNTQELTRAIVAELHQRTGQSPHAILSLLHRSKLDPNREIVEAAQGDAGAERVWRRFHACVDRAKAAAVAAHGFAFLVDVHGHGHPIRRIELGYALPAAEINLPDAQLDASDAGARSTLSHLHARSGRPLAQLLRGPGSLGDLLVQAGYPAVPSPRDPRPFEHPYFAGSYIVRHHTAKEFAGVDGFQLECPFEGMRDTAAHREKLARAVVDAVLTFLRTHYDYTPAAVTPR